MRMSVKGLNQPRSHFKSRLSLIVRVNVVLNRTVVVDSDHTYIKHDTSNVSVDFLYSMSKAVFFLTILK